MWLQLSVSWCSELVSSHSRNGGAVRPRPGLHVAVAICLEWLRHIVSHTRLGTHRGTLNHGPALWCGRQRLATAGCGFQGQAGQDGLGRGRARGCCCCCCCWCLLCSKRQVLYLGRGRGPSGGASAELRLYSSDGGRGREDEHLCPEVHLCLAGSQGRRGRVAQEHGLLGKARGCG